MKLPLGTTVRFKTPIVIAGIPWAEVGDLAEIVAPVTKRGYFVIKDGERMGVSEHEIEEVEAPDYVI